MGITSVPTLTHVLTGMEPDRDHAHLHNVSDVEESCWGSSSCNQMEGLHSFQNCENTTAHGVLLICLPQRQNELWFFHSVVLMSTPDTRNITNQLT